MRKFLKQNGEEIFIYVTFAVVFFVGWMTICKAASDFGDEHFPMSRFIKN